MMYNILILGSGAIEHAIAKSLFVSSYQKKIFCIGSSRNPGIINLCEEFIVGNLNDPTFVVNYAKKCKVQFVIIGPENPLEAGIADALLDSQIDVIGPRRELAMIESSKTFTRNLQKEFNIPCQPEYQAFSSMIGVEDYLKTLRNSIDNIINDSIDNVLANSTISSFHETFRSKFSVDESFEDVLKNIR